MKKITTSVAEMYIDEDGILRIKILPGVNINKENFKEYFDASVKLLEGKKALVLFNASSEYTITDEEKKIGTSKEVADTRIAIAYVTRSLANKLMFNLFISVYRPTVPAKMFASEAKGLKWLKSFYVLPGEKFERKKKK